MAVQVLPPSNDASTWRNPTCSPFPASVLADIVTARFCPAPTETGASIFNVRSTAPAEVKAARIAPASNHRFIQGNPLGMVGIMAELTTGCSEVASSDMLRASPRIGSEENPTRIGWKRSRSSVWLTASFLMAKTLLVTGSSGLIGSEVCVYFASLGYTVHGVDNNQRAVFFGSQGDTRWNQNRLIKELKGFVHHELDIRDRAGVLALVKSVKPSVIVHTAAQPSHDRAAAIPFDDFDTNAGGTLNLLEAARQACPETPFEQI